MTILTFWIEGEPVPKARARTVKTRTGKVVSFTPARTARWENTVRLVAQSACSAVRWKPTKSWYEIDMVVHRARASGDADNFAKAIGDALNGIAYPDDGSVRRLQVTILDTDKVGAQVTIWRAP